MHGTMHGTSSPVHRCRDDGEKTNRIQREKITHACIDLLPGQAANKNNAYLNPFAALPTQTAVQSLHLRVHACAHQPSRTFVESRSHSVTGSSGLCISRIYGNAYSPRDQIVYVSAFAQAYQYVGRKLLHGTKILGKLEAKASK